MTDADDDLEKRLAALEGPSDSDRLKNLVQNDAPDWNDQEMMNRLAKLDGKEAAPVPTRNIDDMTEEERLIASVQDQIALERGMQPGNYAFLDTYGDDDDVDLDDLIEEFDTGMEPTIPQTNAKEFKSLKNHANVLLKEANNVGRSNASTQRTQPQPTFNIYDLDDDDGEIDAGAADLISKLQDEIQLEKKLGISMDSQKEIPDKDEDDYDNYQSSDEESEMDSEERELRERQKKMKKKKFFGLF